jgi:hypothetical protein
MVTRFSKSHLVLKNGTEGGKNPISLMLSSNLVITVSIFFKFPIKVHLHWRDFVGNFALSLHV